MKTIGRWERGTQGIYLRHRGPLAELYGITYEDLNARLSDASTHIPEPPHGEWLAAGRKVGAAQVATAEHRAHALRRLDDSVAGEDLQPAVERELAATSTLVHEAVSTTSDNAARLLAVLGDLYQLAGWVASDTGNDLAARARYAAGASAAEAAGDAALAGQLTTTLAYQLVNQGAPADGAMLADTALAAASGRVPPVVEALMGERAAWAHALAGHEDAADRALERVDDLWAPPNGDDPSWVYWLDAAEVDVMAGRCHVALGRPERARERLERALSIYGPDRPRETALYLSWLAEAHIQAGDPEAAAAVASRVLLLAASTASTRVTDRVHHLAQLLTPHTAVAAVADFLDMARDITT